LIIRTDRGVTISASSWWVTPQTLIDLLARVGACRDAAIFHRPVTAATTGAPPSGADPYAGPRPGLRDRLPPSSSVPHRGRRALDGHQVIGLVLGTIARASALA